VCGDGERLGWSILAGINTLSTYCVLPPFGMLETFKLCVIVYFWRFPLLSMLQVDERTHVLRNTAGTKRQLHHKFHVLCAFRMHCPGLESG
jgi:hypothetical protein